MLVEMGMIKDSNPVGMAQNISACMVYHPYGILHNRA